MSLSYSSRTSSSRSIGASSAGAIALTFLRRLGRSRENAPVVQMLQVLPKSVRAAEPCNGGGILLRCTVRRANRSVYDTDIKVHKKIQRLGQADGSIISLHFFERPK